MPTTLGSRCRLPIWFSVGWAVATMCLFTPVASSIDHPGSWLSLWDMVRDFIAFHETSGDRKTFEVAVSYVILAVPISLLVDSLVTIALRSNASALMHWIFGAALIAAWVSLAEGLSGLVLAYPALVFLVLIGPVAIWGRRMREGGCQVMPSSPIVKCVHIIATSLQALLVANALIRFRL